MSNLFVRWLTGSVAVLMVTMAPHAAAQTTRDPFRNPFRPPTFNEIMADQARELGSALDTRNRLAQERAQQIQTLSAQLGACGSCANRAELQAALDHWKSVDQAVNQAEHAALASMGLGQYRNIGELQVGLAQALGAGSEQVEQQRKRDRELGEIAKMVHHECKARHPVAQKPGCNRPPRGEEMREHNQHVQACVKENDPLRLYANDQMVRQMCGRLTNEAACIAENSILRKAHEYNKAAGQAEIQTRVAARQEQAQEEERRREAAMQEREKRRDERANRRNRTAEESRAFADERRNAFQERVAALRQSKRDCDG